MEVNNPTEGYLPEPQERTVTLADGTVLQARGALNEITGDLWIWMDVPMEFSEAVSIFGNPEKTSHIRVDYSAYEHLEADNYTKLVGLILKRNGLLDIQLNKGVE